MPSAASVLSTLAQRNLSRVLALLLGVVIVLCAVARADAYVYWSNNRNGTIGRASLNGSGASESFIASTTGGGPGGGGMVAHGAYIYWTGAKGGTATAIARARVDGSHVNTHFT